jgi:hypothetical protein
MGNCSSTSKCNPCGPNYDAINLLATKTASYARQANTSAVNAANSATDAENYWKEFNALYLGSFASAPTVDNEGNPLQEGALYFNSVSNQMFVWQGASWIDFDFDEFTPFLATGTTTARNLVTRTADIYNVKDFGAVGNGTTDNQTAFQAAINAALAAGGGTIYIPKGTYWFSSMANSAKINVGNGNLTFKGDGQSSILKFAQPNFYAGALFFNADNTPNKGDLTFQDLQIQGTLDTISGRYIACPMYLWFFNNITIQNVKFKNVASASMIIEQCQSFKCIDSIFEDIAADGARARDTLDCIVTGNKFLRTGDDPIALHLTGGSYSLLKPNPQAERFIVSNNTVINCDGGCVLVSGGRKTIITGNTFTLMKGLSISPSFGVDEGFRPIYDVTITGNSFTDICSVSSTSSKTSQAIALFSNTKAGSSTNNIIPGDYNATTGAFVLPYNYSQSNTGVASESGPRTQNVNISNNLFSITRSGVSAFSNFGYGQRNSQGVYYNPAVPIDDLYANQIIGFYGQFENVNVSNNTIKD